MRLLRSMVVAGMAATGLATALTGCQEAPSGTDQAKPPAASPTRPPSPTPSATPTSRPPEVPGPGDHRLVLRWGGHERTYSLHAPSGYRPGRKLPLVVALHHRGADGETMRAMTGFDAKADAEGFLVAYPDGIDGAFNALICCGGTDDVGFLRALVQHLATTWDADPSRTYATGISNGADMSYRLAIEAPGMFAAIGPVSGAFGGPRATGDPTFAPPRPVAVVSFLGYEDMVRARGVAGLAIWADRVRCTAGPVTWFDAGRRVSRTTATCRNGTQVVSYVVNGMGHAWPGGTRVGLGDPTAPINAVDVMWEFFERHPRR